MTNINKNTQASGEQEKHISQGTPPFALGYRAPRTARACPTLEARRASLRLLATVSPDPLISQSSPESEPMHSETADFPILIGCPGFFYFCSVLVR
jgi:hypothetical protein